MMDDVDEKLKLTKEIGDLVNDIQRMELLLYQRQWEKIHANLIDLDRRYLEVHLYNLLGLNISRNLLENAKNCLNLLCVLYFVKTMKIVERERR